MNIYADAEVNEAYLKKSIKEWFYKKYAKKNLKILAINFTELKLGTDIDFVFNHGTGYSRDFHVIVCNNGSMKFDFKPIDFNLED